jgi:hypothetical protein
MNAGQSIMSIESMMDKHRQYANDPVLKSLTQQRLKIIRGAVPKIVIESTASNTTGYIVYDDDVVKAINKIDQWIREHIEKEYPELILTQVDHGHFGCDGKYRMP